MAGSLLLAADSTGSSANITSTLQTGSITMSADGWVVPCVRLSSLNGAAATITLGFRHFASNGTTLIREQAYSFAKPQTTSTVAGDDMPAVFVKSGEVLTVTVKSSNASDTAAAYTISWAKGEASSMEQVVGGAVPTPAVTGVPKVDLLYAIGTILTEGAAGRLAAAIIKFFNVATPTGTVNSLPDAVPGAAGGLQTAFMGKTSGSVNDAGASTTVFIGDSSLSAVDDFYNGSVLVFTSGTMRIARRITDYTGATKTFTFGTAFPAAPANGVTFDIIGRIE